MINFREESYKNFGKCLVIENEVCTLKVTIDVGPRIIYYALKGMENTLREDINRDTYRDSDDIHKFFDTEENWYIYGGHRLWTSPESWPESYTPDNSPVKYEIKGNSVIFTPEPRTKVGEQHVMIVTLDEASSRVTVGHSVENISDRELKLSPWCMTVGDKGGIEIIPQSKEKTGLLSNRRLVIWEYTDVKDERFYMSNSYITLRQTDKPQSFKIGMNNRDGWCAYVNKGQIFKKTFDFNAEAEYPDFGCNFETFTDGFIVEIETLGELRTMKPGDKNEFEERWELIACDEEFDRRNDESIEAFVEKYGLRK